MLPLIRQPPAHPERGSSLHGKREGLTTSGRAKIARMATTSEVKIGERIARARQDLRLTQVELAAEIGGLDRTAVAKIESGRRKVSASELVRLAGALNRPIDWFVTESPPAVVSRRSDPASGGVSEILDRTIERLARDIDFLERDEVLPPISERRLEPPTTFEGAETAAAEVRGWISAEQGPLLDLQRHAEALGLLAFSLDLGEEGGDGAYVAVEKWGVAVINGHTDPGRRRFSLAHELGHHLFADAYAPEVTISVGETEKIINAFAVHFLLPRSAVKDTWNSFDDRRMGAIAIAVLFRASWSAVTTHLKNLGLIDDAGRAAFAADPPTPADFIELGERWVSELDSPSVPPQYGRRVISAYRGGRLTAARTVELLYGTIREEELPAQQEVPLEGVRREFEALP